MTYDVHETEEKKFVEIAKNYANNKIPQYEASRINPYKTIMIILDDDFPINDSMGTCDLILQIHTFLYFLMSTCGMREIPLVVY